MNAISKLDNPQILSRIFHPLQVPKDRTTSESVDIAIPVEERVELGCRLYVADNKAPVLFYFHGNGETVCDYNTLATSYTATGLNLFVFTYRGYGWSTGSPSFTSFFPDVRACIDFADQWLTRHEFAGMRFVMGRSLGSAAAIEATLAHTSLIKGLIIESGFSDTLPLLESLGCSELQSLSENDGFNNRKKISAISQPTLILHGARDHIIPLSQAESLQSHSGARTKRFFIIPGADHNSMTGVGGELYFSTIADFINEITGESSWRNRRKRFKQHKTS